LRLRPDRKTAGMSTFQKESAGRRAGGLNPSVPLSEPFAEMDRTIFDGVPDMLMVVATDGTVSAVNRTFERQMGFDGAAAAGKEITFFSPKALPGGIYDVIKKNKGHLPECFTMFLQARDRRKVHVEACTSNIIWKKNPSVLLSMRDIGRSRTDADTAERRVLYERAVVDLSISYSGQEGVREESAAAVLQRVGECSGADRIGLFQILKKGEGFEKTHEWCAEGVPAAGGREQSLSGDAIPWLVSRLQERKQVQIDDLNALPAEAAAERDLFKAGGYLSLLVTPLHERERLIGFVAAGCVREARVWSPEDGWLFHRISGILWRTIIHLRDGGVLEPGHDELERAVMEAGVGVWIWNLDSEIVQYSRQWCRGLGFEPCEVEGDIHFFRKRIHPEDFDRVTAELISCIHGSSEGYELEFRMACKDGRWLWVLGTGRGAAMDDQGLPHRFIGTQLDVTGRKEAALEMEKARDIFKRLHLSRTEFLAVVTHELRTPMTGIIGMGQLLRSQMKSAEHIEMADLILQCGEQMMKLIENLLTMADTQTASLKIYDQELDVTKVLEDVVQTFHPQAARKGLKISVSISSRTPHRLVSDESRFRQILKELVENAVKFTPKGDIRIQLRFRAAPNRGGGILCLTVRDSGIGIPSDRKRDIFEPFIQVDSSSISRAFGGAGLGLAKIKGLVDLLHGEIYVFSTVNKGSIFSVRIPVTVPETDAADPKAPPIALIAESRFWNRSLLEKAFRNSDWQVDLAANGLEAVEKVGKKRYNLVLMAADLPLLKGLEAVRLIRDREKERKLSPSVICAIGSGATAEDKERCLRSGVNEYISTPIQIRDLYEIMQKQSKTSPSKKGRRVSADSAADRLRVDGCGHGSADP